MVEHTRMVANGRHTVEMLELVTSGALSIHMQEHGAKMEDSEDESYRRLKRWDKCFERFFGCMPTLFEIFGSLCQESHNQQTCELEA